MSNLIFEGAEFDSYAKFKVTFDEYCRQNAVNGIPLQFVRQSSELLQMDTFKRETLDRDTIERFVYHNKALVCKYRKLNDSDTNKINCGGRITFRYDRAKKVILVSSFIALHTHHPYQSVLMLINRPN